MEIFILNHFQNLIYRIESCNLEFFFPKLFFPFCYFVGRNKRKTNEPKKKFTATEPTESYGSTEKYDRRKIYSYLINANRIIIQILVPYGVCKLKRKKK